MIKLHNRVNIGSFVPFHDENDQFKKSSVSDDVVRVFCFHFCAWDQENHSFVQQPID